MRNVMRKTSCGVIEHPPFIEGVVEHGASQIPPFLDLLCRIQDDVDRHTEVFREVVAALWA